MRDIDVAWLAGLFEGEGNFYIAKSGGVRVTISMADQDVIERVNTVFPCQKIGLVRPKRGPNGYWQTQYIWRWTRHDKVREFTELILPYLGKRRAAKARELLHHLDTRPGKGSYQRAKTHCPQGHPYSPKNTMITRSANGGPQRRCRICTKRTQERSDAKKQLKRRVNPALL